MSNNQKDFLYLPLIIVCLAQIGASGDNSVVSLATGQFVSKLHATMDKVQLANVIYSLLAGSLMVFGGMLGIAKGFKKVFLMGVFLAFLGEIVAVVAPNINILNWGARLLTGLGAAFMIPSVLGIIVSLFNGPARVVAFGAVGAATGVAAIIMPLGAGLIMDHFGYKVAFLILGCWFLVVFILGLMAIPSIQKSPMRVDYAGTFFAFIGLVCFILGCSKISVWGLISPLEPPFLFLGISPALPLIILGMIIVALTLVFENHTEKSTGAALIPQSFIRTRQVRNGLYVTGLIFMMFGAVFFFIPAWIMIVAQESSMLSAIAVVCTAIPMIVLSLLLPKKFAYLSPRNVCLFSGVSTLVGCLILIYSLKIGGYESLGLYLGLAFIGVGVGGFSSQSAMIVSAVLNPRDASQSGGIQASVRNIWQAGGVAIVGTVFLFSLTSIFKANIAQSNMPENIKTSIENMKIINLVRTSEIIQKLQNSGIQNLNDSSTNKIIQIYNDTTLKSGRLALWALFILVALHIPGFFGIQKNGWTQKSDSKNKS
ncbi:MFS transporter [Helicobacter sp. 12S02232-10]|uniref:MFS transporter n=1 Tax=Helicobacter sp. 12S02232-10 TaxID=1476197 RepID=UPI000BA5671D|nr:MFS transporter [Helicobacter sp. 12S02232-10]PAF48917.1 MFS transporter [Helicobacter sp. 12S02232-10]